jgi:hypothetical protein
MAIWLCVIAKYTLAIWRHPIAKCTLAIWRQPIAKNSLAILATSYCLNRNNRASSFYKTRGSKLCFLTCFSYFSCYFHILVFLLNCYVLISSCPFLATQESDFLSRFSYLGTPSWYIVHAPPCFWHRMRGFLEARCLWEPDSRLTTGENFPFPPFAKGFRCKRPLDRCKSYLSYSQKSSS